MDTSAKNTNSLTQGDEISLKELILRMQRLWKYLISRWMTILIVGIIGGVAGLTYAFLKRPVYSAETTFVLEEGDGGRGTLGQLGGLAGLVGITASGGGGIFQGNNIMQLYTSRSMVEKALLTPIDSSKGGELLIERYIRINKLREQWENRPELKKIDFAKDSSGRARDSIITRIVKDINSNYLSVERPDKGLSMISVRVRSEDELFAKEFADHIVSTVNSFYVETKTKKSLDNVRILQQKVDSVRSVMEGAIYTSANTIDATPNLNPTRQVLRTPAQLSQVNADANKVLLSGLIQNLELSKIALLKDSPLIQVIDTPVMPLEIERLGKKKGMIYGGILFGFLCIVYLIVRKVFIDIMYGAL